MLYYPNMGGKMNVVFWNTDTQKDFMNPDGALYIRDAEKIKPILKEITEYAKENNIRVVNTADCHTDKSEELSDNPDYKNTFPKHCMLLGDGGIDFVEETDPRKDFEGNYSMVCYTDKEIHHSFPRARNIIIYKDAFDVFKGNHLADEVVKKLEADVFVVYGVAANVCVDRAVIGLLDRGKKVYVVVDAIKELPSIPIEPIYKTWVDKGAILLEWEQVKEML